MPIFCQSGHRDVRNVVGVYEGLADIPNRQGDDTRLDRVQQEVLAEVLREPACPQDGPVSARLLIAREAKELRPGGETVMTRLADVLIVQIIRAWLEETPSTGWLAALRDPQIGLALQSIHREPKHPWTLESLASVCHISRSAFSAKFGELVGETAMRYVTRWRMQLARARLRESSDPTFQIAEELGYQSDAAFCRAFKKESGVPPGQVRREGLAG